MKGEEKPSIRAVSNSTGLVLVTVTASEGDQCTYKDADGDWCIDLTVPLTIDEVRALVANLDDALADAMRAELELRKDGASE